MVESDLENKVVKNQEGALNIKDLDNLGLKKHPRKFINTLSKVAKEHPDLIHEYKNYKNTLNVYKNGVKEGQNYIFVSELVTLAHFSEKEKVSARKFARDLYNPLENQ